MTLSFIKSSGSIITEDFCATLVNETKAAYIKDNSFGTDVKRIDETIASTFEKLRERWEENRVQILNNEFDTSTLRRKWIIPFLEALGYSPEYLGGNIQSSSGVDYHMSYRGWSGLEAPIIHMVHTAQDLDLRDKGSRTHANKSPQDCLQQFLNTSSHQWAILINGKKIRLLRDFYHSITKGFIEFDLEGIFETATSEQFRVLYRILHRSRIENQYQGEKEILIDDEGNPIETEDSCLLESFHKKSRETGVKVGNGLRDQVIEAIEKLGNGFAEHLNPDEFQNGKVKAFNAEILNIIYRLLFLSFAEQKGWLPVRNTVYAQTYSLNALREIAERGNYSHDEEVDLWEGLKITFKLVSNGYQFSNGDKINAFGGQLFSDKKIKTIVQFTLKNKYLLEAISKLSFFWDKGTKTQNRINYATLAIDELGSVYESLLDYEPKIAQQATKLNTREVKRGEFYLDDKGTDRKTTGSYYTDSRLVAQLIESALVPVIDNAVKDKTSQEEKEKALLELKVADIACGSGAFICAALEKLGERLALIRMGEEDRPTDEQLREAKRDVLLNCIYGVDLNPMALELAKFSLWITASMPDMPLTFLDHKLKCGNSLIGATPDLIKRGIPVEAYKEVGYDNKDTAKWLRAKVKKELGSLEKGNSFQGSLDLRTTQINNERENKAYLNLLRHDQDTVEDIAEIEEEFYELQRHLHESAAWKLADVWTASFFINKTDLDKSYPTNETLHNLKIGGAIDTHLVHEIEYLAKHYRFFHFHLEFPDVFENGGFDCLLGNPPWEKVQPEEVKFFKGKDDNISNSKGKKRKQLVENLKFTNTQLYDEWITYKTDIELFSKFIKGSDEYKLIRKGNLNTYAIFTSKNINITNTKSRWGIIVPSGFATDDTFKQLFAYCIEENLLVSIFDYENRARLFDAESNLRFIVTTFSKSKNSTSIHLKFGLKSPEDLLKGGYYKLESKDFKLFNPNTKNCPAFNTQRDVDITRAIYQRNSVLIVEEEGEEVHNEYGIDLYCEAFNMTRASHLFETLEDLTEKKYELKGNVFKGERDVFLPLYESKLIYTLNHRYSTFEDVPSSVRFNTKAQPFYTTNKDLSSASFEVIPRYWVNSLEVKKAYSSWSSRKWFFGFRNVCRGLTDYRTAIFSAIPYAATGNSLTLIFPRNENLESFALLMANLVSIPFDYVVRQKLGGSNLNFFVFKQLAVVPLYKYSDKIVSLLKDLIIKLIYTSDSLESFAHDFDYKGKPIEYNEYERFKSLCRLDAIYSHLYEIEKESLIYILDTFPIIKRRDIEKFGHYRTKDEILNMYDEYAWVREEMNMNVSISTLA